MVNGMGFRCARWCGRFWRRSDFCLSNRFRLGDTLVEVSIAIGIFSMVAIATVSVINASTSSTQGMLEGTITREEIDAQAEALRFIQSAYVAGGEVDMTKPTDSKNKYAKLWDAISKRALDLSSNSGVNEEVKKMVANYNPTTCNSLYSSSDPANLVNQKAFLINTRAMSSNNIDDILVNATSGNLDKLFKQASTFPRIVYNQAISNGAIYNQDEDSGNTNNVNFTINTAEGLFVVAVKDADGTIIISDGGEVKSESAYIDFYIRSCWFTPSSDRPSTISTVVRLYNPDAIAVNKSEQKGVILNYYGGEGAVGAMPSQYVISGSKVKLLNNQFTKDTYTFMGWKIINGPDTGRVYNIRSSDMTYTAPTNLTNNTVVELEAIWVQHNITLKYNGGSCPTGAVSGSVSSETKYAGATFTIANNGYSCSHYKFAKWKITSGADTALFNVGDSFTPPNNYSSYTINLEAQWEPVYMIAYDTKSSWTVASHVCDKNSGCKLSTAEPTRSGYVFEGWCTVNTNNENCSGTDYQPGASFPGSGLTSLDTTLYAMWLAQNETITINASWSSGNDYDSYLKLQKPDAVDYIDAHFGTTSINVTYNGETYSLITGNGDGRGSINGIYHEKFVINTLGGKNYYYSMYNWSSSGNIGNDITVQISGPYLGTQTFYSKNRPSGSCTYWNVFAYKDGAIVDRNTCTSSMEYGY